MKNLMVLLLMLISVIYLINPDGFIELISIIFPVGNLTKRCCRLAD